jgi:hypothetical protein
MSRALNAALTAAHEAGIDNSSPVLLQNTNHAVFWLRPHPVIAKVSTRLGAGARLQLEHTVAVELAALAAPIATPLEHVRPWVDPGAAGDSVVTLWNRLESVPKGLSGDSDVGASLRALHSALAQCRTALPDVRLLWHAARHALDGDAIGLVRLGSGDRDFLRAAFDDLVQRVDADTWTPSALHGEPHDGNVLATPTGLRWIDLETVCRGPLEWDAVFLTPDARDGFDDLDAERVAVLDALKSACVATWCFAGSHTAGLRRHAERHLAILRSIWPLIGH